MKHNLSRILCLALALVMVLSLCACGDKEPSDPNHFDFGKYEVAYKGACIMYNESGKDALVLKFDFTNNSGDDASYGWTVYEKAMQNGIELGSTYVITDMDTYAGVAEDYFTDIASGKTLEVGTAFELGDMSEVTFTLSDLFDKYVYTITIDPSTLERVENDYSDISWDDWDLDGDETDNTDDGDDETGNNEEDSFLGWWNGDWYGWWIIADGTGIYDQYDGYWWDICAEIEAGDDLTGSIKMWDVDGDADNPTGEIEVSFNDAGVGIHGTMFSEGGYFLDHVLEHADWIVDPGLMDLDDLIWIDGCYYGDEGDYSYEIFLRPWGVLWDDVTEDVAGYKDPIPYNYEWYLSFLNAGKAMPDSFYATVDGADGNGGSTGEGDDDQSSPSQNPSSNAGAETPSVPMSFEHTTDHGGVKVTTSFSLPKDTWCLGDTWGSHFKIYNSPTYEDVGWHTPEIFIYIYDGEENLNFYIDQFENLRDIDSYTIDGIEMKGRMYTQHGIEDRIEYYAQLPNGTWFSISFLYVGAAYDAEAALATCYAIADTIHFSY